MEQLSLDLTQGAQLELPWSVADIEQEIACFLAMADIDWQHQNLHLLPQHAA